MPKTSIYLFLFFLLLSVSAPAQVDVKWSEGEHLEMGMDGSNLACQSLGIDPNECPNQRILRGDKSLSFQYGEIVTAADFYFMPTQFYDDRTANIAQIVKCAYRQKRVHLSQKKHEIDYPSCNMTAFFSMPGYLEVVSQNQNHFGWNNMVTYVELHGQALQLAKKSNEKKVSNPMLSKQLFHKALVVNAFADHYLTDAFASGHIRVPRQQIKEWATENLRGIFKSNRGDLLSMFLHDIESVNVHTGREVGFQVKNSRGDFWLTRGDGHLNYLANDNDLALIMPRLAIAESFKDILIAAEYGDLPEGVYLATEFVPFHNENSLIEKLSPEHHKVKKQSDVISLLFSSVPLSQKLLFYRADFARMLDGLSQVFIKFRQDVARERSLHPALKQRLPEKYIQAYLTVE